MSKSVDDLKRLIDACAEYKVLREFNEIDGAPDLGTWAPNYKVALSIFEEKYPEESSLDKWAKLRRGFNQVYDSFNEEYERNLDLLVSDKSSRTAYFKRLFNKLYQGPYKYERRKNFAEYFTSADFKALKHEIGIDLWEELDMIGYGALMSLAYMKAVDSTLEEALRIEGIPILENGVPREVNSGVTHEKKTPAQIVDLLQKLLRSQKKYDELTQLSRFADLHDLPFVAPDYSPVLTYFNEGHSAGVTANRQTKIGKGFQAIFSEFEEHFKAQIHALATDRDNRLAYIRRLINSLHISPSWYKSLMSIANLINSNSFREFEGKIDGTLYERLTEIGFAVLQCATYGQVVSCKLEEQLIAEGFNVDNGWFAKKWFTDKKTESTVTFGENISKDDGRQSLKEEQASGPDKTASERSARNDAKSKLQSAPSETKPKIMFIGNLQTRLYKTLCEYVPNDQHDELELLLTNGYSEKRIWVKSRADSLAYIFKQTREVENPILADMTEVAKWMAAYFSFGKKNQRPVSETTVYNILRDNKKVGRKYQTPLKR